MSARNVQGVPEAAFIHGLFAQAACRLALLSQKENLMVPNDNEARGTVNKVVGAVKEHLGRATNNPQLQEEGLDQRDAGDVEQSLGTARRKIGEVVNDLGKKIGG